MRTVTPTSFKLIALLFTTTIIVLGYVCFGFWTALIFTSGFLTGYVLWLLIPRRPAFQRIAVPYWSGLALFILHRVEEKVTGFFSRLTEITGVPTPEITSWPVVGLVILSLGGWLAIPLLVPRGNSFGYYLAWTFFAAMGITEMAHFVFPFFTEGPSAYFPGMGSVVVLAPVAWWGMYRLSASSYTNEH